MKKLTCEMCGSTELVKQDGVFVCQTCGTKYSVEDAKKMMKEVERVVDTVAEQVDSFTKAVNEYADVLKQSADNIKEQSNELFALSPKKGIDESQYYVLEHLRDTNYVADDIFNDFQFDDTQHAFAMAVVFGGPITYHWNATSGFDREEQYVEYIERVEVLEGGKIRRYKEPETKTRIVTDWRPSSGTVSDYYKNHVVIDETKFSEKDSAFRDIIGSHAAHYKNDATSLWQLVKDTDEGVRLYDELKNGIPAAKEFAISIAKASRGIYNIPGDHVKDIHDSADFQLESFQIVVYPIIKGQYKHNGECYRFAVDAIDGSKDNLTVDYPIQADDKEKHDLVVEKAEEQKKTRIKNKQTLRNNFIYIEWIIAIILSVFLIYEWFKNGVPSPVFPGLILLFSGIWHYGFNTKFKKEIADLKIEETQKVEQIKQFVQNAKDYKKSLRQKGFLNFINSSGNKNFIAWAKDFVPEMLNADGKVDEILSEFKELEKQENLKQERKKPIPVPKGSKICSILCLVVVLVGLGLMYPLYTILGDMGLILSGGLLIVGPFVFAILARVLYEAEKKKKLQEYISMGDQNEHQK